MKVIVGLSALVLLLGWCGCVSVTETANEGAASYAPVDVSQVIVYEALKDVPGTYEQLAKLHVEDERVSDTRNDLLLRIRKEAAALGANGVVVGSLNAPEVPAAFHRDAGPDGYDDLPQPAAPVDPGKQNAWLDAVAIRVK